MIDLEELNEMTETTLTGDDPAEAFLALGSTFVAIDKMVEGIREGQGEELGMRLQAAMGTLKSLLVGAGAQRTLIGKLEEALKKSAARIDDYEQLVAWICLNVRGIEKDEEEPDSDVTYWIIDFVLPNGEEVRMRAPGALRDALYAAVEIHNAESKVQEEEEDEDAE